MDLRQAFYAHLQRLGRGFYANYHLGDLIARATNDMESIRRFFRSGVHRLVSLIGVTLIAPIFMLQQSLQLTLLLLPLLVVIVVNGWYLAGRILLASAAVQAGFGKLTETVQQNLKGIRTIQCHAQEQREISGNQISANLLRLQSLWSVKCDRSIVLQGKCPGLYLDCVRPPTHCISNGVGSLAVRNCSTACCCLGSS